MELNPYVLPGECPYNQKIRGFKRFTAGKKTTEVIEYLGDAPEVSGIKLGKPWLTGDRRGFSLHFFKLPFKRYSIYIYDKGLGQHVVVKTRLDKIAFTQFMAKFAN